MCLRWDVGIGSECNDVEGGIVVWCGCGDRRCCDGIGCNKALTWGDEYGK